MPEISRFYGIVVRMYYNDHAPPHLHAEYAGKEALLDIERLDVLRGRIARRALTMLLEWASLHRDELEDDWNRMRAGMPPQPIAPLD